MIHTPKYKQRTAQGLLKPIIFIILELIIFALIIYASLEINVTPLTMVAILGSIYYLATSSMPKFRRVIKRQQALHRLKKFDIVTKKDKY